MFAWRLSCSVGIDSKRSLLLSFTIAEHKQFPSAHKGFLCGNRSREVSVASCRSILRRERGTWKRCRLEVWTRRFLDDASDLQSLGVDTLIVAGGETDVCALPRVSDALCRSSDQMHDALLRLYECRYSEQVETVSIEDLLAQG